MNYLDRTLLHGNAATLHLKRLQEQGTQAILEIRYETTKGSEPLPAHVPKNETSGKPSGGTS